jgi:DNA invertase Pin-like site-specific DNA recombinase
MPHDGETRRRAAIYARFSTELQKDRSIDDQVALCRTFAEREGLTVTHVFTDRARTSASIMGRDGLIDLMAAAKTSAFDAVIVEALDRLSRDQEDLAGIHKRLTFAGIDILAVHDGRADDIQIGMRGLLGTLFLKDLKAKVRRGMSGVVRDGRHAGGRAYGYYPLPGRPGELAIDEAEAEVIRRIFEAYADGQSPRAIATALNAEGVPAPRGARWNASTLNGSHQRGHGLLRNEIYVGRIIWNRVTMVRHPETGRRISRPNPPEDWQYTDASHLAIVPRDLWDAVAARRAAVGAAHARGGARRTMNPTRPFSGLLRCGSCGGSVVISKRRGASVWCRCSARQESGTCANTREMRLDRIESAVLQRLSDELADPFYVRAYLAEYQAERQRLMAAARKSRTKLERAADRARQAYDRAHRLYIDGVTDGLAAKMQIRALLDAARAAEAELEACDAPDTVVELHPAAAERYAAALEELVTSLSGGFSAEATRILRELITEVRLTPQGDGTVDVEVKGSISALLGDVPPECRFSVVAEDRYSKEPTLQLLRVAI